MIYKQQSVISCLKLSFLKKSPAHIEGAKCLIDREGIAMPAYNFKAQFADDVKTGTKRQTIRLPRKRPTKPGDRLFLYTGMRTKNCRKLKDTVCKTVTPVKIYDKKLLIDGNLITGPQLVQFAKADGFNDTYDFFTFFEKQYKTEYDFEVVKW